ncbi:DUF4429 domain-containing protein [Nocardiopsis changdeensis]|uniref:DUF4429 domain-containing protein n=1 Tax=Nocardiopsis changdeensis TaxID=2831969 RepID=A0ABX8BNA5_9ACTN|nr:MULTISPECIES: DUF4429 domain-containing protein [Nocardiopsis]QUX23730.1 DUF4429 domain-containing protein [Nocardiopsis changdeensis]QYX39675.1 DUF4429 domain-containing protein [Nocardiopsis sp. MT53]
MDELRGDQADWGFDGETVDIVYKKSWTGSALLKELGRLSVPVGAIAGVEFTPGGGRRKGWLLRLSLRERMDPYAAVGAMLRDDLQPFRLTGPAKTELVAEYLADQIRFAAEQTEGDPAPETVTRLVPAVPLHIKTREGTATLDGSTLRLVWSGDYASAAKRRAGRREYDLSEISSVDWGPPDGWGWGFLRVVPAGEPTRDGRPKHDLGMLRSADDGGEIYKVFLMAATVTAHVWARGGPAPAGPGGRWREIARGTVRALTGAPALLGADTGRDAQPDPDPDARAEEAPDGAEGERGPDTAWIFAQIERLGELHAKGLLTDEEFAAKKAELLDRI